MERLGLGSHDEDMDRPRVITCNVATVDGRLTLAPGVSLFAGDPRWTELTAGIGDPYAWPRELHDPEVLLEGSGSFLAPASTELLPVTGAAGGSHDVEEFLPASVCEAPGRRWFTLVDGQGRVDLTFTEWPDPAWAGWHALVLTSHAAPEAHRGRLRERGIPHLVVGDRHVDLPRALELLAERLGVRTVVCTGGGRLGGALLRLGLVDEIDLEVLPAVVGGRGTPALFDAPPLGIDEDPTALELLDVQSHEHGLLRLRYRVAPRNPGASAGPSVLT